ncbi:MAG: CotH kinase family protein [Pseudomonadota bacterium]|nr:CotH kinase family protein [Pseudomonadota bacterium]
MSDPVVAPSALGPGTRASPLAMSPAPGLPDGLLVRTFGGERDAAGLGRPLLLARAGAPVTPLLTWIGLTACHGGVDWVPVEDSGEDDVPYVGDIETIGDLDPVPSELQRDPKFEGLFDLTHVVEVAVTLSDASLAALALDPRTYTPADVEIEGEVLTNVGLHFKGSSSFQNLTGKPSLKLHFNEFVPTQRYGEMNRLTLNNMVQDPSQAREILTYWLLNEGGGLAPRASYAHVTINGADYGLYLCLEPMDHDFLARRFPFPDGDLWEGANGADLTAVGVAGFELKSGLGDTARLREVATAVATPSADYYANADRYVVMDQALDFWAWQMVTADIDGYPYHLNDWFMYGDPGREGRFVLSPWGVDEAWNSTFQFQWGQGALLFNCAADRACLERVYTHTETAIAFMENADVPNQLEAFYDLGGAYMESDPRRGWTDADVAFAQSELLEFTRVWPGQLRAQIEAAR